jgi:hypothetical protein
VLLLHKVGAQLPIYNFLQLLWLSAHMLLEILAAAAACVRLCCNVKAASAQDQQLLLLLLLLCCCMAVSGLPPHLRYNGGFEAQASCCCQGIGTVPATLNLHNLQQKPCRQVRTADQ